MSAQRAGRRRARRRAELRAPGSCRAPPQRCAGAARRRSCWSRSGRARGRGPQPPRARRRSRSSRWRWRRPGEIHREQAEAVLQEVAENSLARAAIAEGGLATRARCWSRRSAPSGPARSLSRLSARDRERAVRVPAPHAARPDRRLPAQRGAADRSPWSSPACTPTLAAKVLALLPPRPSRPTSPCASRAMSQTTPEVDQGGRAR